MQDNISNRKTSRVSFLTFKAMLSRKSKLTAKRFDHFLVGPASTTAQNWLPQLTPNQRLGITSYEDRHKL